MTCKQNRGAVLAGTEGSLVDTEPLGKPQYQWQGLTYLGLKVSLCRLHFASLVIDDQPHGALVHVYVPMGHLNVLALGNNINCRAPLSS